MFCTKAHYLRFSRLTQAFDGCVLRSHKRVFTGASAAQMACIWYKSQFSWFLLNLLFIIILVNLGKPSINKEVSIDSFKQSALTPQWLRA